MGWKRTARTRAVGRAVALALGVALPVSATAEPKVLTEAELDGVTAGSIRVDAVAFAQASGHYAAAQARSYAVAATNDDQIEIGVGFAEGLAFACCGRESDVAVHSTVSSSGRIVHSNTYAFEFRGAIPASDGDVGYFAYGYTAGFLVALSPADAVDPDQGAVRGSWNRLGRSIDGMIDVSEAARSGDGVAGFAFAPLFALSLRQRVLRDLSSSTPATTGLRSSPIPSGLAGHTTSSLRR